MREGQASRTAGYMALFRALETTVPARARLFQDRYAATFLSRHLRFVVTLAKIPFAGALIRALIDRRWPGPRTSAVARTRFIDDAAVSALNSGIDQVVILGAGFDARAYRLAAMARSVVFEVDHPSTSAAKRAVIENRFATAPGHVRFVPSDFNVERLGGVMQAAGYDGRRRTLFIWEGVTNYLTEDAVDATLRWCAASAAGSRLIFTYVHRQVLTEPEAFEGAQALLQTLRAANEEWTFGLDPSVLSGFLAARSAAPRGFGGCRLPRALLRTRRRAHARL